ncbi:N-acetyl-gamma-glutamyl-phosphate reductase [bacterium]|nr:N-acetyl-gamma-glutamyl-phosphate reductase [bacterium]
MVKAAIIGASGYTGAELVRLLSGHPNVTLTTLCADRKAGQSMGAVFPHLAWLKLPELITVEQVDWSQVEVAFCALPHGASQEVIAAIPEHVVVIDLSADFRLNDVGSYATWYGHAHRAPELQKQAVYALSELAREAIRNTRIIACPGCYPTSVLLPVLPLLQAGAIEVDRIIADSKSGTSGAGRGAKESSLFCEVNEGFAAYGIGGHRHVSELEQEVKKAGGESAALEFTPHLVPMNRGILSTIYVKPKAGQTASSLRQLLVKQYEGEAFVHVLDEGIAPSTHMVRGSNHAAINVFAGRTKGTAIIVSAIDNLLKGASGQAVQNFNIRFGFDEIAGLASPALFP